MKDSLKLTKHLKMLVTNVNAMWIKYKLGWEIVLLIAHVSWSLKSLKERNCRKEPPKLAPS